MTSKYMRILSKEEEEEIAKKKESRIRGKREKQGFQDDIPSFVGYPPLTIVCVDKKFERWIRKTYVPEDVVRYLSFYYYDKELTQKRAFVFLGEIPNMKGHGVYMDFEGKGHWGYHCDQFEPTDGDDCAFRLIQFEGGKRKEK